jgi:hypothetical protein
LFRGGQLGWHVQNVPQEFENASNERATIWIDEIFLSCTSHFLHFLRLSLCFGQREEDNMKIAVVFFVLIFSFVALSSTEAGNASAGRDRCPPCGQAN